MPFVFIPGECLLQVIFSFRPDDNFIFHFFVSVLIIDYPNGKIISYRGEVEGRILNERDGKNGFGYDSIFYSTDLKKSFGQATPDEKKQVSHRARAFAQLRKEELEK